MPSAKASFDSSSTQRAYNQRCQSMVINDEIEQIPLLHQSKFSFMPSTVHFSTKRRILNNETDASLFKKLVWCKNETPKVVVILLKNNGFSFAVDSRLWIGYWGRHQETHTYQYVLPYQKVNHFPGNYMIARKDRLSSLIEQMSRRWSNDEFGFIPETYVLPKDKRLLKSRMKKYPEKYKTFIFKPPASTRGNGIRLCNRLPNAIGCRSILVQNYIINPYLVDGFKIDLRIYVAVTSWLPLRAYIYNEGIVRFASCKYATDFGSLTNPFIHLTNYSINKHAVRSQNADLNGDQLKWPLTMLWDHLEKNGADCKMLKSEIFDIVLKTLISCEDSISVVIGKNLKSSFCCYELYGFDILLDEHLKPWLIEVNISPSVRCSQPVDYFVKVPLVRDVLNISCVQVPTDEMLQADWAGKSNHTTRPNSKMAYYAHTQSEIENKLNHFQSAFKKGEVLDLKILDNLTVFDLCHLTKFEDEFERRGGFVPLFPVAKQSVAYLKYFRTTRYENLLLAAWAQAYNHSSIGVELLETIGRKMGLEYNTVLQPSK